MNNIFIKSLILWEMFSIFADVKFIIMVEESTMSNFSYNTNEMEDAYRKIHFAVMAIESGARKLHISGDEMEKRLMNLDLIHKRLIGQYELLHTQSIDYVSDDIAETLVNWERNNKNCVL